MSRHATERGFTLLETILAMAIVTVFSMQVWDHFLKIKAMWRTQQFHLQAILIANGEMERLYALYQYDTPTPESSPSSIYPDSGDAIHPAANHLVHGPSGPHVNLLAADLKTFQEDAGLHAIYYLTSAGGAQNVVWLDQEGGYTARLSWFIRPVNDPIATPCYGSSRECQMVTLFLDYPYRMSAGGNPLVETDEPIKTLALRTIIGKRY
ncbi:MAG: prepilin-type N-terminal cleavage/methylation domain-containing protein [Magnetococcales bacterium]|nr:prepilin-type N-terminal cleavage/methylation domain-containing protein [Magnetococcales bacterium]